MSVVDICLRVERLNNIDLLKKIADKVYSAVKPLLGTKKAGKIVGSGFGGDKTALIDEVAEETVIRHLKRHHLACTFIGEERGVENLSSKPEFYLMVDAVDGTTNAIRGLRFVSTSLALSSSNSLGGIEAAVVMDLSDGGIYEAAKGEGARYDGKKIRTSDASVLDEAVVGVDFSRVPDAVEKIVPLVRAAKSVRSLGSAALEICHVASGCLDAYVDLRGKLRTVDIAAAMLIVEEAGGVFLQPDGASFGNYPLTELNRFSVIASANKQIHGKIASLISGL
jgi:myo-inositol-1(or 4)-monophosphatase